LENVNKGGQISQQTWQGMSEKCVWQFAERSITNLSKDENFVPKLVDILSLFCFSSCKEGWESVPSHQVNTLIYFLILIL
jgi:hypothetical protein